MNRSGGSLSVCGFLAVSERVVRKVNLIGKFWTINRFGKGFSWEDVHRALITVACMGWSLKRTFSRRIFQNFRNRIGGVATPRVSIDIDDWLAIPASSDQIRLRSCSTWQISSGRSRAGNFAAVDIVAAKIDNPVGRYRYRQYLQGPIDRGFETFVVALNAGRVAHQNGLVVTSDNQVLAGASGISFSSPHPTNPLRLTHLRRPRHVAGSVAVVACFAGENYYHWFISSLARIQLYEEAGVAGDARFYVPVDTPFQRESLRMLGISADRILPAREDEHLLADQLFASSWRDQQISPETCEFLHRRLTHGLPDERPATARILIMRNRRGRRSIVNQHELLRALAPLGFEPVWLERLPLAEQIELFHRAECVVGPHGAGLTNLLFCRPGAVTVEINTPLRVLPCFAEIAQHRGLQHHLELATPVNQRHFDPVEGVGDSDLLVEAAAIRQRVEWLLANRETRRMAA